MIKQQAYKALFLLFGYLFLAATCAKESDEKYPDDEEDGYQEAMYGKGSLEEQTKIAIADWHSYSDNSKKLIAIAEANLNTIRIRSGKSDVATSLDLISFYNKNDRTLKILKRQFDKESKIFTGDPEKITQAIIDRNKDFKRSFRANLIELNVSLDKVVEDEEAIYEFQTQ